MSYNIGNPGNIQGLEIVTSNFEYMQTEIEQVAYPDLKWPVVLPAGAMDTSVNPGAAFASYKVRDHRGKGAFRSKMGKDVPVVSQSMGKVSVNLELSGISAQFDTQDIRQFTMGVGADLFTDSASDMRIASDRHIEEIFFFGYSELQYESWLDYTGVPTAVAALNAGATSTEWVNKTADEILFDINDALATVWEDSLQVHLPNRIFLPPAQYAFIITQKVSDAGSVSILKYILENNLYTTEMGQPFQIIPLRYLSDSGAGDTAEMRVDTTQINNKPIYWLPVPLQLNLLQPQQNGFMVSVYGEYIFGGVHIKYPESQLSITGI